MSGQFGAQFFIKFLNSFWTSVRSGNVSLTSTDLTSMLIKSVVFGLLISIIAVDMDSQWVVQKRLEQVQQAQL